MNCERCGDIEGIYPGPNEEGWCIDCYSSWCDYSFEMVRDAGGSGNE